MHLVKRCTVCKNLLRFPIDKNEIRVRCSCGYSFVADPDDPELYKNAQFDLSINKDEISSRGFISNLNKWVEGIDLKKIYTTGINKLFNLKYKIQNFKHLPTSEQRRFLLLFIFFISTLLLLIYLMTKVFLFLGKNGMVV